MSLPIVRHEDTAQIRMIQEAYSEKVKYFPLKEIRPRPHRSDGFDAGIIAGELYLQAYALFARV